MSVTQTQSRYSTVGVIGHIDHGKTSLVGKLTGIETDTHPEEKRRGITIDLGFASLEDEGHTFAFIDAPGHQKYVGNLLAGVSAVDIGLLVVACDQGIQEQTLEHASVLRTLGVPKLVVALSRIDLCDEERRLEVTEELEVFLADYGFQEIPVVPVSSITGEGIPAIRQQLRDAVSSQGSAASWQIDSPFRMPVDRVLNVPGRGLVVAGTIWSGQIAVGDSVVVAGYSEPLRVREIEVHGRDVERSHVGVRTAVNLAAAPQRELQRGDELVAPEMDVVAKWLIVDLELYAESKELRCPATVQMHTATTACEAKITGVKQISPGGRVPVLVNTDRPILARHGQACLFRKPYPVGSFGGGKVIGFLAEPPRKKSEVARLGQVLMQADPAARIAGWVEYLGELTFDALWLELQLGIPMSAAQEHYAAAAELPSVLQIDDRLVDKGLVTKTKLYIVKLLNTQAQESDDAWCVVDSIARRVRHTSSAAVVKRAIDALISEQAIVSLNGMLAIASEETQLSKKQRARMQQLLELYAGTQVPPTTKEAADQLSLTVDAATSLLRHATQQRILIDIGSGFHYAADVLRDMLVRLKREFDKTAELSLPQIKECWGLTRKHLIPLLEYCDKQHFTARRTDARCAGKNLESLAVQAESPMEESEMASPRDGNE